MTSVSVIQATITISSPHRRHLRGSTSKTFLSILAHDWRRRASAEPGVAGNATSGEGVSRSSGEFASSPSARPFPSRAALEERLGRVDEVRVAVHAEIPEELQGLSALGHTHHSIVDV